MATSMDYITFVCDQIRNCGDIRHKKMFGEYMVYVNDKPILLVCDNTVYVKMKPEIEQQMADATTGVPYKGAKEHYILDVEDTELTLEVIGILEPITPLPKPRKKPAQKPQAN